MRRWKQERRRSLQEADAVSEFVFVPGRRRLTRAVTRTATGTPWHEWLGEWTVRGKHTAKKRVTKCEVLGHAARRSWLASFVGADECALDDGYVARLVSQMRRNSEPPSGVPARAVILELSKRFTGGVPTEQQQEAAELLVDLFQQNKVSYADMCAAVFVFAHLARPDVALDKKQALLKYLDLLAAERAPFERRMTQLAAIVDFAQPIVSEPLLVPARGPETGWTLRLLLAALVLGSTVPQASGWLFGHNTIEPQLQGSGGAALQRTANTMAALTGPPLTALKALQAPVKTGSLGTTTLGEVGRLERDVQMMSKDEYAAHMGKVLRESVRRNWDTMQVPIPGLDPGVQTHLAALATVADAIASDPEWILAYLLQLNPDADTHGGNPNKVLAAAKARIMGMLAASYPEVLRAAQDAGTGESAEAVLDRVMQPRYVMNEVVQEQTALRKTFRTLTQRDRQRVMLEVAAREAEKDNDLPRAIQDATRALDLTLEETAFVRENIVSHALELGEPRRDIRILLRNTSLVIDWLYRYAANMPTYNKLYYLYSPVVGAAFFLKRFVQRRFNVKESVWQSVTTAYNNDRLG